LIIPPAAVYCQNVMSEGTLRQWCRMFKDGPTNVHDEEREVYFPNSPHVFFDTFFFSKLAKITQLGEG
jgi:hypothetical protein